MQSTDGYYGGGVAVVMLLLIVSMCVECVLWMG